MKQTISGNDLSDATRADRGRSSPALRGGVLWVGGLGPGRAGPGRWVLSRSGAADPGDGMLRWTGVVSGRR